MECAAIEAAQRVPKMEDKVWDSVDVDASVLQLSDGGGQKSRSGRRPRRATKQPVRYQDMFVDGQDEPMQVGTTRRPTRPGRLRVVPGGLSSYSGDSSSPSPCSSPSVPDVDRGGRPSSAASSATFSKRGSKATVPLIEKLLPGHKIARGRGRRKQLEQMTEEEKEAERQARMEKMRISARECRLRKKNNIAALEHKLQLYEKKDKQNRATISKLRDEMRRLQENVRALTSGGHRPSHRVPPGGGRGAAAAAQWVKAEPGPAPADQLGYAGARPFVHTPPTAAPPAVPVAAPPRPAPNERGRALSFATRAAGPPPTLDFAAISNSVEHRLPTPRTPITPKLALEDLIAPGFALPTPPAHLTSAMGPDAFTFAF